MDLNELQSLGIRELTEYAVQLKIGGGISGLNKQELTVKIMEAQLGLILKETDIVRYKDIYGRVN